MQDYVSWCHPYRAFQACQQEINEAIANVLNSGQYVLGNEVSEFEKAFAEYFDYPHVAGVANGTDALILALKALHIQPNDEVITTAHTALATVAAIVEVGAIPVLVDIEEDYYCIDPKKIEEAITPNTRAIIAVHMYGMPCNMEALENIANTHHLPLIEDCAQAHGAQFHKQVVGQFGTMATFSFYPTKNLGCIGDGGAVVSANQNLHDKIIMLRQYGWDAQRISQIPGINSRLDELQAAILKVKLKYFHDATTQRKQIQETYLMALKNSALVLPKMRPHCENVAHLFVVRHPQRAHLLESCRALNIGLGIHYPTPIHLQPGYKDLVRLPQSGLPILEKISKEIVSLPIYPGLTPEEQQRVIDTLLQPKAHRSVTKLVS